jgi:hypothetical protein
MRFLIKISLITAILAAMHPAVSQDTLLLRNNDRVVCTVTKIYLARVEYLKFGDTTDKQYYSYPKHEIRRVHYADGRIDTIELAERVKQVADTIKEDYTTSYQKGFNDGYQHYQPNTERLTGVTLLVFPFVTLPACIYFSVVKVKPGDVMRDYKYNQSKSEIYKNGYLDGASKRRRVAAWSSFGAAVGTVAVVSVLYMSSNGQ